MELDNIKDLWKKENIEETPEISTEKQEEIHSPLEMIRKNMKAEFWMTVLMIPILILALVPLVDNFQTSILMLLIIMIMIFVVIYYFSKFRTLYKRISTQSFRTYTNLLNLRYELVLNTELYKSYYVAFVPIFFCTYLIAFEPTFKSTAYIFMLIMSTLAASFILIIVGKIWLKEMYGKYIVQISDLIMDLSDEKDDFVFNRSSLNADYSLKWTAKTKVFFIEKFGQKTGAVLNTVFWSVVGFMLMLAISFLIGYLIGIGAAKFNLFDEAMSNQK